MGAFVLYFAYTYTDCYLRLFNETAPYTLTFRFLIPYAPNSTRVLFLEADFLLEVKHCCVEYCSSSNSDTPACAQYIL